MNNERPSRSFIFKECSGFIDAWNYYFFCSIVSIEVSKFPSSMARNRLRRMKLPNIISETKYIKEMGYPWLRIASYITFYQSSPTKTIKIASKA